RGVTLRLGRSRSVLRDDLAFATSGQSHYLIRILAITVLHARRADGHAGNSYAEQVGAVLQQVDLFCRHVAFLELTVDDRGVAGAQARGYAGGLLETPHVGFHMIIDREAVVLQVQDPVLAAAAVGVAVDVNGQVVCRLGQTSDEQTGQGDNA